MKKCKRCLLELPLESFYKYEKMADGYLSYCKRCSLKRMRIYTKRSATKIRERNRRYMESGRATIKTLENRRKHPERYRARQLLRNAIRRGEITKTRCHTCGNENAKQLDGHHPDYSKPLDVMWLCKKGTTNNCHLKIHFPD